MQVGAKEGKEDKQRKRNATVEQERTELTPTGVGAVCPDAYDRIHNRIHDGAEDCDGSGPCGTDTEYVGIVEY